MSNQSNVQLAQQSFALIKQKKSLLIPSAISMAITLGLLTLAAIPITKIDTLILQTAHVGKSYAIAVIILLLFFLVMHCISQFFHAVSTLYSIKLIKNEPIAFWNAFKMTLRHFPVLFLWVLVMTTLGIMIRQFEYWMDRWSTLKAVENWLAGLSWFVATFFIIPVLVIENNNLAQAIKRSAHLVKEKWGDVLMPRMRAGMQITLIKIASVIPLAIALIIGDKTGIIIGSTFTAIIFLGASAISSAIRIVSTSALYLFATGADTSRYFDAELLRKAFREKV